MPRCHAVAASVCGLVLAGLASAPALLWADVPVTWRANAEGPRSATPEARFAAFHKACGANDAALASATERAVARQLDTGSLPAADEIGFHLRAAGDTHPWARGWSLGGTGLDDATALARLEAWSKTWAPSGTRRCAFHRGEKAGQVVYGAVAIDALADLATPLPTQPRVGQWLTLEATLLVPATAVKVVLLGPKGAPKTVLSSLNGSKVRSTFSLDQPGGWVVQVLATVSTGPRPVLEASLWPGATPPASYAPQAAPGEDARANAKTDDAALLAMVNAARKADGLPALARDAELDKLALAHSRDMAKAKSIGHDVGGGDPSARIRAAGLTAKLAGENVSSAADVVGAHRALWASPSHRGNLLLKDFSRVGIAVLKEGGRVWVTQLFRD